MRKPRRNRPLIVALYINAALLLAVLLTLLSGGHVPTTMPAAFAADLPSQPIAGGGGIYLMPAQFSERNWGCYVMDVEQQTLCAYTYSPGDKKLRLAAAREFRYDRMLREFNTDSPSPSDVAKLVEIQDGKRPAPRRGAEKPANDDAAGGNEENR